MGEIAEIPGREAELWKGLASGDASAREELLAFYETLAVRIAGKLYAGRWVDNVDYDDYVQYALLGLIEAVDRYDMAEGVKFSTFAGYRIRGSILDGLPKMTEAGSQYEYYKQALADRNGSLVSGKDLEFGEFVDAIVGLALGFQLDALSASGEPRETGDPYSSRYFDEALRNLSCLVNKLPASQYMVIRGHYFEFKSFADIGGELALSRSRVSRHHRDAILHLRQLLRSRDFSSVL